MVEIKVSEIDYSRLMLREIDGQTVSDLKKSIEIHGVLENIVVFFNEKQRYEVIDGNHRLCAAKGVGLRTIPCSIKKLFSSSQAVILGLHGNVQRLDMNPLREGEIYNSLLGEYTIDRLAQEIGKSRYYVDSRIKMFTNLHKNLREKIGKTLTLVNAIAISRLPSSQQMEVYDRIERNSNIPIPKLNNPYGGYGGNVSDGLSPSPYCTCEKCGAKHLRGVDIKDDRKA